MCRHITKEQQLEGWRAVIELLPKFKPDPAGWLAALKARLRLGRWPEKSAPGAVS